MGRASARPKWGVDPESIRDALIEKHIAADSKLAQFVGIKAYEKAGGAVLRDLFDDENAGWLTDPALVNQLAAAKLEKAAEAVRAEGWKWVEIMPDLAWESTKDFGKAQPTRLPPTAEQQKEIDKLTAEGNAILDQHGEDPDDDEVRDRFYEIQERIDELQQGGEERTADDKANAGAIIGIGNDGKPDIRRGLIKPEDRAAAKKGDKERNGAAKTGETGEAENPGLSAKLVEDLTAHRGITSDAVRQSEGGARCHRSRLGARLPLQHKPSLLRQGQRFNDLSEPQRRRHRRQRGRKGVCRDHQSRHQGHAKQPEKLWAWLLDKEQKTLLAILAVCAACTVDTVEKQRGVTERDPNAAHAAQIAKALKLDMARYWQPTAASYFGRVSKRLILEAVTEGIGKPAAAKLSAMKKEAMAANAAQLLAGKDWLPAILR